MKNKSCFKEYKRGQVVYVDLSLTVFKGLSGQR